MDTPNEFPSGFREFPSEVWDQGHLTSRYTAIADEVPIAIGYNGISHAVMLATPSNLEDFGLGFSLSEGIVGSRKEIREIEVSLVEGGISVDLTIASERFAKLKERRRSLAGRTGCGLCGTESIDQVFRPLPQVARRFTLDVEALHNALAALTDSQPLHALTGAIHAVAWGRHDGSLALVREDVGRHNALDKLIGGMASRDIPFDAGFAIFTSRASSEMVQKAAMVGIPLVAAISAPTGLAIQLAERSGVTLVGFLREGRHTVYANADRLVNHTTTEIG